MTAIDCNLVCVGRIIHVHLLNALLGMYDVDLNIIPNSMDTSHRHYRSAIVHVIMYRGYRPQLLDHTYRQLVN